MKCSATYLLLGLICAEVVFSALTMAQGKVFYVAPTGNDQNDGLTIAAPFLSIVRGINAASAGDTVYLLPGTYYQMVNVISKSGVPEKPIYILGYDRSPGQRPVIDGGATSPSNTNSTNAWMIISNAAWIEIGHMEFRNGWTNPIHIFNSSYLTLNDSAFYGGKVVITASGATTHHVLVQNCSWDQGGDYLWTLVTDPTGVDAWTSMHHGLLQYYNGSLIAFNGTGGSFVIRNNTIINAFNGIRWSAKVRYDSNIEIYDNSVSNIRDNDFEPEAFTYNLHIYHNLSHNIHKTMSIDHVQGGNIYYFGNRITSDADSWSNQICTGFWKVYGDGTANLTSPLYAFNNSFCGGGKVFSMDAGTVVVQVKHFNNAYYITGSRTWLLDVVDSTNEFDYDISNKSWPSNILNRSQEQHGTVADVLFADPKGFDLRLKPTSPAIDKGTPISFPELGWTQSYQGSAPDIGAYEGDELQEGPPFRFRLAPGMIVSYAEKPRIVRSRLAGSTLSLDFSEALNPVSVSAQAVTVMVKGVPVAVSGVSVSNDNYRMDISLELGHDITPADLSLAFNPLPRGSNGETATLWAAAIPAYKRTIISALSPTHAPERTAPRPTLEVYPNPLNGQRNVSVRLPSSCASAAVALIRVYDILGRRVTEQATSPLQEGIELPVNVERLVTGTYFIVAQIGNQSLTKRFIVIK